MIYLPKGTGFGTKNMEIKNAYAEYKSNQILLVLDSLNCGSSMKSERGHKILHVVTQVPEQHKNIFSYFSHDIKFTAECPGVIKNEVKSYC